MFASERKSGGEWGGGEKGRVDRETTSSLEFTDKTFPRLTLVTN